MLNFVRLILGLVLLIALVANAARHREKADEKLEEDIQKESMLEYLDQVQLTLKVASEQQWAKMKIRSETLLNFVQALNELRIATIDLTSLLLDSSECTSLLDRYKESSEDIKALENLSFDVTFIPNESLKGGLDHVEQVVDKIEQLNTQALDQIKNAMNSLENSYNDMLTNIVETNDLQAQVQIPTEQFDEYMANFDRSLREIDAKVDQKISETQEEIREAKQKQDKSTVDISNVLQDLTYSSKFQCSVVSINPGYEALECLNDNDIEDLFVALKKIEAEITGYYNTHKQQLASSSLNAIEDCRQRLKLTIDKIIRFFDTQKQRQDELFRQMKEGIEKGNIDQFDEEAFKLIQSYQQAEEVIKEIWKKSEKNYKKTLERAKAFEHFPTAIRAIERVEKCAAEDDAGGNTERLRENLHEFTRSRFKLGYDGKYYHKDVFRYVYDLHTLRNGAAGEFLEHMLSQFEKKQFMAGRRYFIQDIRLLLENILQLVLRSNCDASLILILGRPLEVDRYIRKYLSYINILELVYPNSLTIKKRMGLLTQFLEYYRQNSTWVETLPSCKTMADLQKYRPQQ